MNFINKYRFQIFTAILFLTATAAFATGDIASGKKLFNECAACHSLERGVQGMGPSLQGVFGRKVGAESNFRYSPAMKRSGIIWSEQTLDAFIADPQAAIKGNRMPYSGIGEASHRADLIEYLRAATK